MFHLSVYKFVVCIFSTTLLWMCRSSATNIWQNVPQVHPCRVNLCMTEEHYIINILLGNLGCILCSPTPQSFKNTPTTHTVGLALFMWFCNTSFVMVLLILCNNSIWCPPSIVIPSSCSLLLLWCFLLTVYCGINRCFWGKITLCNTFIQKRGVDLYSSLGLFSRDFEMYK